MNNILCGALVFLGAVSAGAATVIVPVSADTSLNGAFTPDPPLDLRDNNMGGLNHVSVGNLTKGGSTRALYRFDLTGRVPAGSIITSVKVNFTVITAAGGPGPLIEFHRLLQSWTEGDKVGFSPNQGDPATAGETTWNNRMHPATPWGSPGADGPGDASTAVSASIAVDAVASYVVPSTAGLVADAQAWVNNSASNFGWLLKPNGAGSPRHLNSREMADGGPTLEITFSAPVATDIHVDSIQRGAGGLTFTWTGGSPQYQLATATDIAGPWTLVGPKTSSTNITASLPAATTYYRVAGQVP